MFFRIARRTGGVGEVLVTDARLDEVLLCRFETDSGAADPVPGVVEPAAVFPKTHRTDLAGAAGRLGERLVAAAVAGVFGLRHARLAQNPAKEVGWAAGS